jgi:hypothetical protein
MQKMVTANGTEHGLLHTLINQVPKSKRFKNVEAKKKEKDLKKDKAEKKLKEKEKRDTQMAKDKLAKEKVEEAAKAGKPLVYGDALKAVLRENSDLRTQDSQEQKQQAGALNAVGA